MDMESLTSCADLFKKTPRVINAIKNRAIPEDKLYKISCSPPLKVHHFLSFHPVCLQSKSHYFTPQTEQESSIPCFEQIKEK